MLKLALAPPCMLGTPGTTLDFKLDATTLFDAVELQLGLKLENRQLPLPVLILDRVERVREPPAA